MVAGVVFWVGIGVVLTGVLVRMRSKGVYEVKLIDLAVLILPLALYFFATGKVRRMVVGNVEFEMAEAFVSASMKPIEKQVSRTQLSKIDEAVEVIVREEKGGTERIPRLIENKVEALEFYRGKGKNFYWSDAIREYFESLGAYDFLKYVVVYAENGTLLSIFDARPFLEYFRSMRYGSDAYYLFAEALNDTGAVSNDFIQKLPGRIPEDMLVNTSSNTLEVLKKMESENISRLPVIDARGCFIGVVDRDRITANLLITVTNQLRDI